MAKKCFIYETMNTVGDMQVSKDRSGLMTLSGVFGVCGVRNNNKRVYETSNYSKMVTEMQGRIKADGAISGELEHPQTMNITLENVSHKITDIRIDEAGVVTGTIVLLNTPKGKIAQAIVEGGLPLFVSSRAVGAVGKNGDVVLERISTYDLVGTPGFSQARMHLNENQICESLSDNIYCIINEDTEPTNENNTDTEDMNTEIQELLEELRSEMDDLRSENRELRSKVAGMGQIIEKNMDAVASGMQKWILNEVAPLIEGWIQDEFAPEALNEHDRSEDIKSWILDKYTPLVQDWITEHYSPAVQKWITEEYSTELQNWITEEFATDLQKWIVEEYSGSVTDWVANEALRSDELKEVISESLAERSKNSLDSIDQTLRLLESMSGPTKPTYGGSRMVTEAGIENLDEPRYVREMPEQYRAQWNMASEAVKESIHRRAKLYNFLNEGANERFWSNINFEEIRPAQNIYEGLDAIQDQRERSIRAALRKNRRF